MSMRVVSLLSCYAKPICCAACNMHIYKHYGLSVVSPNVRRATKACYKVFACSLLWHAWIPYSSQDINPSHFTYGKGQLTRDQLSKCRTCLHVHACTHLTPRASCILTHSCASIMILHMHDLYASCIAGASKFNMHIESWCNGCTHICMHLSALSSHPEGLVLQSHCS